MCLVVLCNDQQARSLFVDPMDDPGPDSAANLREPVEVEYQCVGQRPVRNSGARVNDQSGRLIHYNKVVVLIHDVERDLFALQIHRRRFGEIYFYLISRPHAITGLGFTTVDENVAIFDGALKSGAAETIEAGSQKRIQALTRG